jgi:inner membrane protein
MLIKTHLAITLCLALFFVPYVKWPLMFLLIALLATYIPDIDSKNSKIGNHWYLRPFQWLAGHRGFVHSFSFLVLITVALALFLPYVALPFFLGYSSHLVADSFTVEGIMPFYPLNRRSSGNITTGGINEFNVFVLFVVIDGLLFLGSISFIF